MESPEVRREGVLQTFRKLMEDKIENGEEPILHDHEFNDILTEWSFDPRSENSYIVREMIKQNVWERIDNGWVYGIKFK